LIETPNTKTKKKATIRATKNIFMKNENILPAKEIRIINIINTTIENASII